MIDSCKTMKEFCDLKHTQLYIHTDSTYEDTGLDICEGI